MIKQNLKFGKVIKQGKTVSRFIVQDKIGLYLLALLFNKNLVTIDKINSYILFINKVNSYNRTGKIKLPQIELGEFEVLPTLQDAWLSGFTDAEGCFSVSIYSNSQRFSIIFDIAQKGIHGKYILDFIQNLFKIGKVYNHHAKNNYYYRINGLKGTNLIIKYFDSTHGTLKTKKLKSYLLWKILHDKLLNKEHLDLTKRYSLKVLSSKVNNTWD